MPTQPFYVLISLFVVFQGYVQAQFECSGTSETAIKSPYVLDYDMPTCTTLISMPPDLSRQDFRDECARWLGTPVPDTVHNYYISYCEEQSTYTAYQADICCDGVQSELRCFQCTNFTSDYTCAHDTANAIVSCSSGQVCQTTTNFYEEYPYTVDIKTSGCADQTTCEDLDNNDPNTCKDYIASPLCTECCSTSFCNYDTYDYDYYDIIYDPCDSNPCYYGGTCTSDTTAWTYTCICVPPYSGSRCSITPCDSYPCENGGDCDDDSDGGDYQCNCRTGWTGKNCTEVHPQCDSAYCQNGGTCFDHGIYGFKCRCPTGFVGSHCEIPTLGGCSAIETLVQYTSSYETSSVNCTEKVLEEKQSGIYDSYFTYDICPNYMQQSGKPEFVDNVHGNVDRLESAGVWKCEEGNELMWYSNEFCCPTCHLMPCENGAWCVQESTMYQDYICQCRAGWAGAECQNKPALCIITGDPHYTTYDSALIHFQGVSSGNSAFQLSGTVSSVVNPESTLRIFGKNKKANGGRQDVSYLSAMIIEVLGHEVEFYTTGQGNNIKLKVKLDGVPFDPTSDKTHVDNLEIILDSTFLRCEADLYVGNATYARLSVRFNAASTGTIDLPPEYNDLVEGICGNADGVLSNDYVTKEGVDVTNATDRYTQIGDSWEINVLAQDRPTTHASDIVVTCESEYEPIVANKSYCGLILDATEVFSTCINDPLVNQNMDYQNCYYDTCAHTKKKKVPTATLR